MIDEQPVIEAKLVVPSSREHLPSIRSLIEHTTAQAGFPTEDIQRIVTAAFEAVVNAITHGSPHGSEDSVSIGLYVYRNHLVIEIEDKGSGITDGINKVMPDITSHRGRGIPLMYALMDDVKFVSLNGGTKVILTKYLNAD